MNNVALVSTKLQIICEEFKEVYAAINQTISNYLKLMESGHSPLLREDIVDLERKFRAANENADRILKIVRNYQASVYSCLNEEEVNQLVDFAWLEERMAAIGLSKILRYSSKESKFFPKTFEMLESIGIERIDELTYQGKLEILEVAGEERDEAMKRIRPKLMRLSHSRDMAMKGLLGAVEKNANLWRLKGLPLMDFKSRDEASVYHPALHNRLPSNKPNPHAAQLGRLAFEMSIVRRTSTIRINEAVERFRDEEDELIERLRIWFRMKNMYRPASIDEFLADPKPETPIS